MNEQLRIIARTQLGVDTLDERRSDSLDFHEVSVWGLRRALEAAYEAGRRDGLAAGMGVE
ncbi:hypothetical protein [Azospirillum sp. Sh1]|uniref:DUF6900 domain-containing protein n=1 Tax=Azospirillum sp. Sh1 TaxID=2607285 RepID=UPI0011EFE19D|nr:hypothetical protein [Azospirillum sp. Sh1]KAA0571119.1 hypothetical protein FZ029_28100 [Azospirillum sp. Sh1]